MNCRPSVDKNQKLSVRHILAIGVLISLPLAASAYNYNPNPPMQGYCGAPPPNSWFQFSSTPYSDVKARLISTLTEHALADYPARVAAWFAMNGGATRQGNGCQIQLHASDPLPPIIYCPQLGYCLVQLNGYTWSTCGAGESTHVLNTFVMDLGGCHADQAPATLLTISLSGGNEVEPSKGSDKKTLPFIAAVIDQNTGQPTTNQVQVHISLKVDPTSGGHDHGDNTRPRGGIAELDTCDTDGECWSHVTDGNGQVVFNFNAPEASGTHTIAATCDGCTNTATANVNVKVDGLEIIPDSLFYTFVGDTNNHSKNHYLAPEASTVLRNIAISYRIEDKFWQLKQARRGKKARYTYTPPSVLHVNDASLIWGGKFDIHGKWTGDHKGHRRGIVIDIRANQINIDNGAIPPQSFASFQDLATSYDAIAQVHCSHDGQDRQPQKDCIGNDGSQDNLRHFHVILVGGVDK